MRLCQSIPYELSPRTLSRSLTVGWTMVVSSVLLDIMGATDWSPFPVSGLLLVLCGPFAYFVKVTDEGSDSESNKQAKKLLGFTRLCVVPLWLAALVWMGIIELIPFW